jgi:hypothetical protein
MWAIRLFIAEGEGLKGRILLLREPVLLKKVRRPRSRTRFPNRLPLLSGRRNSLSNCASRVIWLPRVFRRRRHWSRLLRQERLSRSEPLQRRDLKPRQDRRGKRLGRRNWRKRGGGLGGRHTRHHPLLRGEWISSGRLQIVKGFMLASSMK